MRSTKSDLEIKRKQKRACVFGIAKALGCDTGSLAGEILRATLTVFRVGYETGHGEGWRKCERFHKWYSKRSEAMPKLHGDSLSAIRWAMWEAHRQGMRKHCGELAMILAASEPTG